MVRSSALMILLLGAAAGCSAASGTEAESVEAKATAAAGGGYLAAPCVQSDYNVIPNAGFDKSPSNYQSLKVSAPVAELANEDASGCAVSKALRVWASSDPRDGAPLAAGYVQSACFAVTSGMRYDYGVAGKVKTGTEIDCRVFFWKAEADCKSNTASESFATLDLVTSKNQWQRVWTSTTSTGAWSKVVCSSDGEGLVDELYLSPTGKGY